LDSIFVELLTLGGDCVALLFFILFVFLCWDLYHQLYDVDFNLQCPFS
jgi:hypothetical protein